MDRWAALHRAVGRDHRGVVHLADAPRFGIEPDVLRRRAAREEWRSPFPLVWLLPGTPDRHDVLTHAAIRSAGEPAFATSWSAASLQDLAAPPRQVHLLLPHRRKQQRHPGVRLRRTSLLLPRDVDVRPGQVPATTVPRTALQLACDGASPRRLKSYLVDAFQRRLCSLPDTIELLERVRGVPGRPALDAVVAELVRDMVDSMLESDTRDVVRTLGYRPYPRPFPLACPDGRVVHLDVAFPEFWHAIECDGAGAHMDRRNFETDRIRWSEIQRMGVTITWVTRDRLERDVDRVAAELADAFTAADPSRAPLQPAHDCSRH